MTTNISSIQNCVSMTTNEIATITGKDHDKVCKDVDAQQKHLEIPSASFRESYLASNGHTYDCYRLPRHECFLLVSGYSVVLRDRILKRWAELEQLQSPATPSELEIINFAIESLNLSSTAKVIMLTKYLESKGLDSKLLPSYVDEQVGYSARELLATYEINISTQKFNTLMIANGLLEVRTRQSQTGKGIKRFKSLTSKCDKYGKNMLSKHTQPQYFKEHFQELLGILGLI